MASTPVADDEIRHDEMVDAAEAAESGAANLFDLRTIIGGLFTLYGAFLIVLGIFDGEAALAKAEGVRINLWTGLGLLAMGLAFLLWARMRPLTARELAEAQTEGEGQAAHDELAEQRGGSAG